MKLSLPCVVCAALSREKVGNDPAWLVDVEVRDDGAYLSTCRVGHAFVSYLNQHLFEMLFELAVNAIVDGYYREAVTSFAASLERFYEYSMKVFSAANAIPDAEFTELWKRIGGHSERQLGAYIALHVLCIRKSPVVFKKVAFRNDVVHKGKIPSMDEALAFGEDVRELINNSIDDIKHCFGDTLKEWDFRPHVIPKGTEPGMMISYIDYPTVVSLGDRRGEASLRQIVEARRAQRKA